MQLVLDGQVSVGDCPWCGRSIREVATPKYMSYLRRLALHGLMVFRCPLCEIEFAEIVYELSKEAVQKLREKWYNG